MTSIASAREISNRGVVVGRGVVEGAGVINAESRWVYNFDGIDDRIALQYRAINPGGDNSIEFWSPSGSVACVIISQNISATESQREFQLWRGGAGELNITFGGVTTAIFSAAQGFKPATRSGITIIGTEAKIYEGGLGGALLRTTTFTIGAAREPTAQTLIGCRASGSGSFAEFFQGQQYDVRINGVLWPIQDRNQPIQLPQPSGLGAELITPTVLENPATKGTQWTYLGNGRWQYIGDGQGGLQFILAANIPDQGFIEYEVESYQQVTGVGSMRISPTTTNFFGDRLFNTTGRKRSYYTVKPSSIEFTRNNPGEQINCIIKNISFKPLYVANPSQMVTNGDFSAVGPWLVGPNQQITGGELVYSAPTGSSVTRQPVATQNDKSYEITYTIKSISGGAVRVLLYGNGVHWVGPDRTLPGAYIEIVRFNQPAGSFTNSINIQGGHAGSVTAVVDDISLREITSLCNPATLINSNPDRWSETAV